MSLQLNKPYLVFVAVAGTTGLVFIGWAITASAFAAWSRGVPLNGGWNWPLVLAVDLACLACCAALYWKIYCDAQTVIDAVGVRRPGLLGRHQIEWREVTDVRVFAGVGLHIYAAQRKLVVSPYVYREPAQIFEIVRDHVLASAPKQPN